MGTYNLVSYENGRVVTTVVAKTYQEAKDLLESKGYDCQDDFFLETIEESTSYDKVQRITICLN